MKFYLGTSDPGWLYRTDVPLFVSHPRLQIRRKTYHRATCSWALDSGGFTELSQHGQWRFSAREYAASIARYAAEIGSLDWAAPQDWMCEDVVLAKTGLTIREHQRRTVESFLLLRSLSPLVIPVLQGWSLQDYEDCVCMYAAAGVNLFAEPVVGVGTLCRRQHTNEATHIIRTLASYGLRMHGFGFKILGLRRVHKVLASSDSLAWSVDALRSRRQLPQCIGKHVTCSNCFPFAKQWRARLLQGLV